MLQPVYWGKDNTLLHSSFSCLKLRSDKEKAIVLLPGHCGNAGNGTASSTKPLTPRISSLLPALMKILCSAVHPSPPIPGFPQVSPGGQINIEETGVSVIIHVTNHNSFITLNGRLLELAGSWTVQWDPLDEKMICMFFPISPKCPTCSTDTAWTVEPGSCYTGTLAPRTWPLSMPKAGRQVQSLDTEALPKFGKETRSLRRALSLCAVSYNPDIYGTWT